MTLNRMRIGLIATIVGALLAASSETMAASPQCVGGSCCLDDEGRITGSQDPEPLVGSSVPNCVLARGGNDVVAAGGGADFVVPGSGADDVRAGPGDDIVVVYDTCELAQGEVLRGGPGMDTLVIPVPLSRLGEFGVSASGFENVIVDASTRCRADCRLPCSRTPAHLRRLPEPTSWSVDRASGARYRRATRFERRRNGWRRGTFLVESSPLVEAVTRGDLRSTVLVPFDDDTVRRADLELSAKREGLTFIERRFTAGGLVARSLQPTFFEYVSAGLDFREPRPVHGVWMGLLAGSDGGVYGYGLIDGFEVVVDAPNPGWAMSSIEAPGGPQVEPGDVSRVELLTLGPYGELQHDGCSNGLAFTCEWLCAEIPGLPCDQNDEIGGMPAGHHCVDDDDNDDDGKTDNSDEECAHHPTPFHSSEEVQDATWGCDDHPGSHTHRWESGKSFVLFGEGRFCTYYANNVVDVDESDSGNWIQRLTRMGWDAEVFLRQAGTFSGLSGGEDEIRLIAGGCWIFPSMDAAETCADGGACDVPDAGEYPYQGAGDSAAGYYQAVWDDVHHATAHGLGDPLHLAQVVYFGGIEGAPDPIECQAEEGSGCCGAAPVGSPPSTFDGVAFDHLGASVMQYNDSLCVPHIVASHELGHALGLDHDSIYGPCPGGGGGNNCKGFMHASGGAIPLLSAGLQGQFDGCRFEWDCPRPSGFRYNGPP